MPEIGATWKIEKKLRLTEKIEKKGSAFFHRQLMCSSFACFSFPVPGPLLSSVNAVGCRVQERVLYLKHLKILLDNLYKNTVKPVMSDQWTLTICDDEDTFCSKLLILTVRHQNTVLEQLIRGTVNGRKFTGSDKFVRVTILIVWDWLSLCNYKLKWYIISVSWSIFCCVRYPVPNANLACPPMTQTSLVHIVRCGNLIIG